MKDKLEKTGKTRSYYRKHFAIKISLIAFSFLTICAIPIGVSYKIADVANAAQDESSKVIENSSSEESNVEENVSLSEN